MKDGEYWTTAQLRLLLNSPDALYFRYAWIGGKDCLQAVVPGEPPARPEPMVTKWRCKGCGHEWPEPGDCRDYRPSCPKCGGLEVERVEKEEEA